MSLLCWTMAGINLLIAYVNPHLQDDSVKAVFYSYFHLLLCGVWFWLVPNPATYDLGWVHNED